MEKSILSNSTEAIWLIRSNGHILGPYTKSQVEDLLRTREIVVVDEICRPMRIWRHINEIPELAKVVEEVRIKNENFSENTYTETNPLDDSLTMSVTGGADSGLDAELTQEITFHLDDSKTQEIVYENLSEESTSPSDPSPLGTSEKVKTFVFEENKESREGAKKVRGVMWGILGILCAALVGGIVFKKLVLVPKSINKAEQQSIHDARLAYKVGDYDLALRKFERAFEINPQNIEIHLSFATLLTQVRGDTFKAREILVNLLGQPNIRQEKVLNMLAVSHLIDGDLSEAKNYLQKATQENADYTPANYNLAVLAFQENSFEKAKTLLEAAVTRGDRDPATSLMLSRTLVKLWDENKDSAYLEAGHAILSPFLQRKQIYTLESLLIDGYVYALEDNAKRVYANIIRMLNMDPNFTEDHRINLNYDRRFISWRSLEFWCRTMAARLSSSVEAKGVLSMCLLKAGNSDLAKKTIESALDQDPTNVLLLSMFTYVANKMNLSVVASTALAAAISANKEEQSQRPLVLQGEFCKQSQDLDCAEEYWMKVLFKEPDSVLALSGLAQIYWEKGEKEKSKEYLVRALNHSAFYRPMLQLKSQLITPDQK